jgi:hypothetical protein
MLKAPVAVLGGMGIFMLGFYAAVLYHLNSPVIRPDIPTRVRSNVETKTKVASSCLPALSFTRYVPSKWENEWYAMRDDFANNDTAVCAAFQKYKAQAMKWLDTIKSNNISKTSYDLDPTVFSHFEFKESCTGNHHSIWIEPLVGNFRHPHAIPWCKPQADDVTVQAENRDYLLLPGIGQFEFQHAFFGRKLLFDLGTSSFPTGLGWFMEHYKAHGIIFDEIWAWELRPMPAKEYWDLVPKEIQPKLHFYNTGVNTDIFDQNSPVHILEKVYKQGDYLVFKLDIDNSDLELPMIAHFQAHAQKYNSLFSDILFEMHYNGTNVEQWFGNSPKNYLQTLELFHDARKSGLRIHYWP